jgi:uncharacterized protein YjhX (UPF0386 family)
MWNHATKKHFRQVLIDRYRNDRELEIFLMDELGVKLAVISQGQTSLEVVAFDVIHWAEASGQLDLLLTAFCRENPNHPLRAQLNGLSVGGSPPVSPPIAQPSPPPVVPPAVVEILPESLPQDVECNATITWGLAERGGVQRFKLSNGKQIEVTIPAGVRSGQRLRLAGQGQNGGDLYLGLQVQPQPEFSKLPPSVPLQSEPDLVSAKGVDYRRLRDLLQAGQWQEADRETAERMFEVAGRTRDGYLWAEDIERFPAEDLQMIDQLWVHHSNGRFGFSVQARIYLELGGTLVYNTQPWRRFGDCVGWWVDENWLKYSDLTFDISAPKAHLPVCLGSGELLVFLGSSLAKRFADLYSGEPQVLTLQPSTPEPELVSAKGVDYRRLRALLQAGQWQEADRETAKRMCEVAERTKEGWLREEDIDRFPCEDLQMIDQLWVHHSNGQFGFSVQAKIYRKLGGTRGYNERVWRKFGDSVGWRVSGNWLTYSDLTFDTSSPLAHLPLLRLRGVGWGWFGCGVWWVLLSRIDL